jgi:hypothetical protein
MADRYYIGHFRFVLQEPHFPSVQNPGRWIRAECTQCQVSIFLEQDDTAQALLHRLSGHVCERPDA